MFGFTDVLIQSNTLVRIDPQYQCTFAAARGFIVFEGLNGVGKSTLQKSLSDWLSEQKVPHVCTFEPGDTELGKALRGLLLNTKGESLHPLSELLLFLADRKEHLEKVILPALHAGKIVLCDRYYYSSVAFQGFGRGLSTHLVSSLNDAVIGDARPDLVILLDLDPVEGLRRAGRRSSEPGRATPDSFESEKLDFHTRLRQGFVEIAEKSSEPFLIVNAAQSERQVFEEVLPVVQKLIEAHKRGVKV